MKKILIAILCITMMVFGMSATALAEATADLTIDRVYSTAETVDVPVYLTEIPDVVENIMAITLKYSYDANVLEYVETKPGTASGNLFASSDKSVSWADATDLAVSDAKITSANIGKDNPLFTLSFKVLDNSSSYTDITIDSAELSAGNLLSETEMQIVKLTVKKHYNLVPGRVIFSEGGEGEGDSEGEGTEGEGSGEGSTGGTEGEGSGEGSTGGTEGEGSTGGSEDDSGDEGGSAGGSGGGSGNAGGLKPNTGGTSGGTGGSSGGSTGGSTGGSGGVSGGSGSSSNKGGSTGGGVAVTPQTPPVTEAPTDAKEEATKASDIFTDVPDDHWAAKYTLTLYNNGIVSGSGGKANLDNMITREETSKLALLVNGIEADTSLTLDVADASSVSDWAKSFMATAIKEGIFSGYEDGTVRPLNQITREEMVTVIIKSLKIEVSVDAALTFADASSMDWSAAYVAKAVELGFVNGYEDNTFKPGNAITRAEAFTIFARVLEYKNK